MINQVLLQLSNVGISVERGSSNRAWIKAAYLFVEHFIIPVINQDIQDREQFAEETTIKLLLHLISNDLVQGCQKPSQHSDLNAIDKCLPIRSSFVSIKRLKDKYSNVPGHSHLNHSSYGKLFFSSCKFSDWSILRSILVGVLLPDETGKNLLLHDKSGCIPLHCFGLKPDHLHTVSLLTCWNFIPNNNIPEESLSYIEVLSPPVVLASLKKSSITNELNPISGEQHTELLHSQLDNNECVCCVSGYVYNTFSNASGILLYLVSKLKQVDENCFHQCCAHHHTSDIIVIQLQLAYSQHEWCSCLIYGSFVTITGVQIQDKTKSKILFVTTQNSKLSINSNPTELFENWKSPDLLFKTTVSYFADTVCSLFVGKLSHVVNAQLGIFSINDEKIICFLNSLHTTYGIRKGALLLLQNFHLCKVEGRNSLVSCENSSVNVVEYSNESSDLIKFNSVKNLNLHPSTLYSLLPVMKSLQAHVPSEQDLFKEEWFVKEILPNQAENNEKNSETTSQCNIQTLLSFNPSLLFNLSVKMLCDAAISKSKSYFISNSVLTNWKSLTLKAEELIAETYNHVWDKNVVLVGRILSSKCGFVFSDESSSIKCIVLPSKYTNHADENKYSSHWKNLSPSCNKYVGSLLRLIGCQIIVERRTLQFHDIPSSSDVITSDNSYQYIPCLVLQDEDIIVLKSNKSLSKSNPHQQIEYLTSSTKNSSQDNQSILHLLFILYKGPLLKISDGQNSFCINAIKYCNSSKLDECVFQFKLDSNQLFTSLYPTMLIELETSNDSEEEISSAHCYNVEANQYKILHIKNFDESQKFSCDVVVDFFTSAYECWKMNRFAQGIEPVTTTCEMFLHPPSNLPQLVAVRGKIVDKIEWTNSVYDDVPEHYLRYTMTTSGNHHIHVKVELHENCSYEFCGLIPGTTVTFYRLKCNISAQGDIYFKLVPGSFHVIHSISDNTLDTESSPLSTPHWTSSLPRNILHDLYMKFDYEQEHQAIMIEAYLGRLLSVNLSISQQNNVENSLPRKKFKNSKRCHVEGSCSNLVSFHAKTIISDGSARAILHFNSEMQTDFCQLAQITTDEWNDVIRLLRHSASKTIDYDCDLNFDKELLIFNEVPSDGIARRIAVALFNDINDRLLPSRKILMRRRKTSNKRAWTSVVDIDKATIDGLEEDPLFRIGTVPIECQGSTSLRSLSLRLLQFNCLAIN